MWFLVPILFSIASAAPQYYGYGNNYPKSQNNSNTPIVANVFDGPSYYINPIGKMPTTTPAPVAVSKSYTYDPKMLQIILSGQTHNWEIPKFYPITTTTPSPSDDALEHDQLLEALLLLLNEVLSSQEK